MADIESPLLTKEEAARYLRLPLETLNYYRSARKAPTYRKLGRNVYYLRSDLDEFIAKSRVSSSTVRAS